jgi:hypothetical protein
MGRSAMANEKNRPPAIPGQDIEKKARQEGKPLPEPTKPKTGQPGDVGSSSWSKGSKH